MRLFQEKRTKLPNGMAEFNDWAADIISSTGLPDNDSMRFALAGSILGLKSSEGFVPKGYFQGVLIKAAASQVAVQVMQDLKDKQKAEQEAAAKQQVEATTPPAEVSSDAQVTQN